MHKKIEKQLLIGREKEEERGKEERVGERERGRRVVYRGVLGRG